MGCRAVIHILGQSGITGGSLRSTQDDNCGDGDDDDVDGDEYIGGQLSSGLLKMIVVVMMMMMMM